jgi:hypothetical protein
MRQGRIIGSAIAADLEGGIFGGCTTSSIILLVSPT